MVARTKTRKSTGQGAAPRSRTAGPRARGKTSRSRGRKPRLQLKAFRKLLLEERQRLHKELEEMMARTARRGKLDSAIQEQNLDDDLGDAATETLERGTDMALERNLHDILEQIEESLEKIETHTYGICSLCSGPISAQRLKALPYATLCIRCQERLEQ